MKFLYQNQIPARSRGQAIVEFAIVLPILLMMLVGVLEVGRMIFIYAAVTNASREAARYGSAVGLDTGTDGNYYQKFKYCEGIRSMARRSAYFMNLADGDIVIEYDHGPGTSAFSVCDAASGEDADVAVNDGTDIDRIVVTVTARYDPMVNLVPISGRDVVSSSARTILGIYNLSSGESSSSIPSSGGGGPGGSGGGATPTTPPTATWTPTNTPIATWTNTPSGEWSTLTPVPSGVPSETPTMTLTPTLTFTPTVTFTPTMTFTPTLTPTAVPGCGSILPGQISYFENSMRMTITNPHEPITVASVRVRWNSTNGGAGNKTLVLKSANLVGEFWTGTNNSGDLTITPTTTTTIPGNNATSTIIFIFDRNYQTRNNLELITINLSTVGCETYPIQRP